jgi:hypothetical protein
MKEPVFNQFKFLLIEIKKSCYIKHHASKTKRQLSSFFISKAYKWYHRGKLKSDGDSFFEKYKQTNLGCPPSSHVIDWEIDTKFVYGWKHICASI